LSFPARKSVINEKLVEPKPENNTVVRRRARIAELDLELAGFSAKTADSEEKGHLAEQRRRKGAAVSTDLLAEAEKENEAFDRFFLERQKLVNEDLANDALSRLEKMGAAIPDRERAMAILTSAEIVHYDRHRLADVLGFNLQDQVFVRRITTDKEIGRRYGELMRAQLVTIEYKNRLLHPEIGLVESREVKACHETVNLADLNDPEIAGLGLDRIKGIIRRILNDPKSIATQGTFSNTLVPEGVPYVLKTRKIMEDPGMEKYQWEALLHYPIVKNALGAEFLPRQAALAVPGEDGLHILQEKIDTEKMASFRARDLGSFLAGDWSAAGDRGAAVRAALGNDENGKILARFIAGAEKLYRDHRLMIDVAGDNLFIGVKDQGELDIKLVDYGCFYRWNDEPNESIAESAEFLKKLKRLVGGY
jgi:hypothetical protein